MQSLVFYWNKRDICARLKLRLDLASIDAHGNDWTTWIGMNHIGFNDDNHWHWSDDNPVDYVNWAPNEPNDPAHAQCVQVYGTTHTAAYKWDDDRCDHTKGYVCKNLSNSSLII